MLDDTQVEQYLERIGARRPVRPDPQSLRSLQAAHLRAVPFENLSIHLGEPVVLDEDALFHKVVVRRRGGFCYELNGAFASLLTALGFPVALLGAQVHGEGGFGPPFDHLTLRVDAGGSWLVDVGFGDHSLYPLRWDDPAPQIDPAGVFSVVPSKGEGDFDVLREGQPQYRVEPRGRRLSDFEPTCWWQATSSRSHFTQNLVCTLPVEGGRVTLSGNRLIRAAGGDRTETILPTDADLLDAYLRYFGISLERLPQLPGASTKPNQQAK